MFSSIQLQHMASTLLYRGTVPADIAEPYLQLVSQSDAQEDIDTLNMEMLDLVAKHHEPPF